MVDIQASPIRAGLFVRENCLPAFLFANLPERVNLYAACAAMMGVYLTLAQKK